MVHVETLMVGQVKNDWETVSLYCDDSAVAKGYELNPRATALCMAIGKPEQIKGDAFLARARDDNNDLYERSDIRIDEFGPKAEWVLRAKTDREALLAGGSSGAIVAPAVLSKFEAELESWVQKKLKEWDEDDAARKKHEKKHASRDAFEASLRSKMKA